MQTLVPYLGKDEVHFFTGDAPEDQTATVTGSCYSLRSDVRRRNFILLLWQQTWHARRELADAKKSKHNRKLRSCSAFGLLAGARRAIFP